MMINFNQDVKSPILEGVSVVGLLDSLHDVLVHAEGERNGENGQGEVRRHREDGAERQRQQHKQHAAEHNARPPHIAPVDQVQHCRETQAWGC